MVGFKAHGHLPVTNAASRSSNSGGKSRNSEQGLTFSYCSTSAGPSLALGRRPALRAQLPPLASLHLAFASIQQQLSSSSGSSPIDAGSKRWLQEQLMKLPIIPATWRQQWQRQAGTPSTSTDTTTTTATTPTKQKKQKQAKVPARVQPAPFNMDPVDATLWAAFSEMDTNGDLQIDWVELRAALEKLGLPCTPEYLVSMMNAYDLDRDNQISWDEFRWYVHKRETAIEEAFKAFDIDGNGEISTSELRTVLAKAGIPAREDDIMRMVDKVDGDFNHTISYDEFRRWAAFLPDTALAGGNPMLYAAWWRDTSALSASSRRAAEAGGSQEAGGRRSPFQHFVFFDLLVRSALAISLVVVVQSSLDVGGGLE